MEVAKTHVACQITVWKTANGFEAYDTWDKVRGIDRVGKGETIEQALNAWLRA